MTSKKPSPKPTAIRRMTKADWVKYDDECLAVLAYEFRTIDRNGDPQRVPKPSRDATQPAQPAGYLR